MSIDITNCDGDTWKCSNYTWCTILDGAEKFGGWQPMGTVMYKHSGLHPDMEIVELSASTPGVIAQDGNDRPFRVNIINGSGDAALAYEQATKSGEVEPDWPGDDYTSNSGQVITDPDAHNLALALRRALVESPPGEDMENLVLNLIDLLEAGPCRIT